MKLDFDIADEGPIVLFTPITEKARQWVKSNVPEDRRFGPSLVFEHTFAEMLVREIAIDGFCFAAHRERYAQ